MNEVCVICGEKVTEGEFVIPLMLVPKHGILGITWSDPENRVVHLGHFQ